MTRIAPASATPAQPKRRRRASPNARTSSSRHGASAMLNHAMRTLIGFAASTAPPISRQCSGPGKSSAAGSSAMVQSASRKRKSLHGSGSRRHAAPSTVMPGKYGKASSCGTRSSAVGQRAVEVVEAREAGVAVVGAVRVLAVQQALAGELDLVARVVGEEPRLGRVAQRRLQGHRRQHEADDRAHARGDDDPRAPAPHQQAGPDQDREAHRHQHGGGARDADLPLAVRRPHERRERPGGRHGPGLELAGRVGRDGRDDEDGEAEHRAQHRERLTAGEGL